MIRRSTAIAAVAILVSLLVHFLGLGFTLPDLSEQPAAEDTSDVVTLGNAFEDVAEAPSDPVEPESTQTPEPPIQTPPEPEPAQVPEPPVETPPDPETEEMPTSDARVASSNPQRVSAPDQGMSQPVKPETTGPAAPEDGKAVAPETTTPSGGDDGTAADPSVTPQVTPDTIAETPKGNPDAETTPTEPEVTTPVSPAPQQLAALPALVAPQPAVTPSPAPATVPVVPLQSETVEPAPQETATETTEEEADTSDLAVAASPRPPLRPLPPSTEPQGTRDGSEEYSELLFPPLIESPLTSYLRGQSNLEIRQNGGVLSGGAGFQNLGGPGNSDTTNYAGQVLMHLNRAPNVPVSGRGFARVYFLINPDGTLAWVDIIDSSGVTQIDRAAKEQVRIAAPFPRPPSGRSRQLAFIYRIN
ncbi:energy transducer TonB family protein [Phaeobacter marinintestinus]|uniref:energy transducer TonB family protein n=1 Tax=Falsiphaeobacter marinintestinus TaxID=1492905 RepID=UPI0011B8231C|nr:energy transducer TonB [Phaeobacter marinintestinus]